ncbi:hypothetical protein AB0F72_35160 [Actinoplanes sp. NPDC023936]|uniref:hypothetical protein n=1 Tax=Actinoplanes sp. NPDC023936 TaxID=3154910 RepID=UPI0033DA0512
MTDKKGISEACSSVLRRAALTMGCCAAALAVVQGQATAGSPSPELPIAGRAAPAPRCGPICSGHIKIVLDKLGFPVVPPDYELTEVPIDISVLGTQDFQR